MIVLLEVAVRLKEQRDADGSLTASGGIFAGKPGSTPFRS
jgi:hypothetical protein